MKKLIILSLFFTFGIQGSLMAQFSLNLSAGANYTDYKFTNVDFFHTSPELGYFVGVAPSYQITDKIRLQVDVHYSQKATDFDDITGKSVSRAATNYLDIIPEIEYDVLNFLALGVGVNYGLALKERFKYEGKWSDKIDSKRPSDFGLVGKLKVSHKNIFGFVRYNLGLKDISDFKIINVEGKEVVEAKQLNRNLQIGVGYRLGL